MLTRNKFSELSEALSSGFFADNAVLVLSRIKKESKLSKEDMETLKEIVTFFDNVLRGFAWSDNPKFSSRSATSASAFSQAAKVTLCRDSKTFSKTMKEYLAIAKKLLASEQVPKGKVEALISFFGAIGKTHLEHTDNIINIRSSFGTRRMFHS